MARKRYSDEDCLKILRQVEVELATGVDVATGCRSAGISDATFYKHGYNERFNAPYAERF